jgi:hypothetical protein
MNSITLSNTPNVFQNFNNINNVNMWNSNNNINNTINNNITGYVPYSENCPINFFNQILSLNNNDNNNNFIQTQNQNIPIINPPKIYTQNNINSIQNPIKNNRNNNQIKKVETDADLIQDLTGNYLKDTEETFSEEKIDKKEIEINLGKIIVNDIILNDFPIINVNDMKKYNIFISENILNNSDFFTAIKDKKEANEMNIEEEEKKIIVPDNYILNIDENIYNNLKDFLYINERKIYTTINKIIMNKVIEILYDRCLKVISEIKRNIKNRAKKVKNFELSNTLQTLFKLHNELYNKFLIAQNQNPIQETKEFFTYVQDYIQNSKGKKYKCEICSKEFINFHKLGGHTSKMHPNCSEKYKKQNDIRKQREGNRQVLDYVKEKLFEKYNLNYRKMKNNDEKYKIKIFIKAHQKEYEILRRKIQRENSLKSVEE